MRLVTYRPPSAAPRGGIVLDASLGRSGILDLEKACGTTSVLDFVANESEMRPKAEAAARDATGLWPLDGTELLAPIPRPPSMRDADRTPVFYFTNHQALVGPGDLRVQKLHAERLDFELECAIVIGKECKNVRAENADAVIFGMTIMNDFSARALQMEETKLGSAKGKDFATGLGPWLVTLDDLGARKIDHAWDLEMRASVNGTQLSKGNVKDMPWSFAQLIERASYGVTLYPGDVIGSGTWGTGSFLELNDAKITQDQWLKNGDVVALEIDLLGRLENRIVVDDAY
jgi:fumarylacetoacetate (FAA) hydrolase